MKNYFLAIAMLAFVLSACGAPATLTTETPTPQVLESTPVQTSVNDTAQWFSSNRLGLCFSYPEGYT